MVDIGLHAVDVVTHYNFPRELDGSGQTVALITLGGEYRPTDLRVYCTLAGITVPTVIDETAGAARGARNDDTSLLLARDLELLAAGAPGAQIALYRAENTELGIVDAFSAAIGSRDPPASVICVSWAIAEGENAMLVDTIESMLMRAAMMGISVCAAVDPPPGPDFASSADVPYPASSPNALACGPSSLAGDEADAFAEVAVPLQAEVQMSRIFAAPEWQTEELNQTGSGRVLPDVTCLGADTLGYQVYAGEWVSIGGGGASACLWAGLLARLTQGLGRPLGLFAPYLYKTAGPAGLLRAPLSHPDTGEPDRARGWRPAVGWGSPDGEALLNALRPAS